MSPLCAVGLVLTARSRGGSTVPGTRGPGLPSPCAPLPVGLPWTFLVLQQHLSIRATDSRWFRLVGLWQGPGIA